MNIITTMNMLVTLENEYQHEKMIFDIHIAV